MVVCLVILVNAELVERVDSADVGHGPGVETAGLSKILSVLAIVRVTLKELGTAARKLHRVVVVDVAIVQIPCDAEAIKRPLLARDNVTRQILIRVAPVTRARLRHYSVLPPLVMRTMRAASS